MKKLIIFILGIAIGMGIVKVVRADYTPTEQEIIEENIEWTENEDGEMIGVDKTKRSFPGVGEDVKCTTHCVWKKVLLCNTQVGDTCIMLPSPYEEYCK